MNVFGFASLANEAGAIVIAGLISPYAADREYAREAPCPVPKTSLLVCPLDERA